MVRIIGARESSSKTKAAREKIAECEIPGKVEISFANQNSCRQVCERTGRREEFDEAFSRYLCLPVNANENRLPFIAFTLLYVYPAYPGSTCQVNCVKTFWFSEAFAQA